MELPAQSGSNDQILTIYKTGGTSGAEADRNYTINYSNERYAALWTAYTLTEVDVTTGNTYKSKEWAYNGALSNAYQVGVVGASNSYPSNYQNAENYSRGHQIPNADRTSTSLANEQTYYVTNQTPQLANGFNGGIWGDLEKAVRGFVVTDGGNANYNASFTKTDVLYVITGPCYGKAGTSETPAYLTASNTSIKPSSVPVPKYYWKVLLKVEWKDSTSLESACAIGFWMEHKTYANDSYTNYAVSVDQIEAWTGFDLFTNLPGDNNSGIEQTAESNTDWTTFQNF